MSSVTSHYNTRSAAAREQSPVHAAAECNGIICLIAKETFASSDAYKELIEKSPTLTFTAVTLAAQTIQFYCYKPREAASLEECAQLMKAMLGHSGSISLRFCKQGERPFLPLEQTLAEANVKNGDNLLSMLTFH